MAFLRESLELTKVTARNCNYPQLRRGYISYARINSAEIKYEELSWRYPIWSGAYDLNCAYGERFRQSIHVTSCCDTQTHTTQPFSVTAILIHCW